MKKYILTILFTLGLLTITLAQTTTFDLWFTWNQKPAWEAVTNYVIEQSKVSPYTNFIPVVTVSGTTNVGIVRGLTAGTYKFRVVAKNGVGSSDPSNVLSYPTNAPSVVTDFNFTTPR